MLEYLEPRIAPAAVVTYTDIDGDLVKITASKGPLDAADLVFVGGGTGGQLRNLNLGDAAFAGANIVFTVVKTAGGDGFAHVGLLGAEGVDLGRVVVKGDLAVIRAGDADPSTPAVKALAARSMGAIPDFDTTGVILSLLTGGLGSLNISGDFGALLQVTGATGTVNIGGDVIGGDSINRGRFDFQSVLGIRIAGDVVGGSVNGSGNINAQSVGLLSIGGDLIGGAGLSSGAILVTGGVQKVSIGGDVIGGSARAAGQIFIGGQIGNLLLKGSLRGGAEQESGAIFLADSPAGKVAINGSIIGGSERFSGSLQVQDLLSVRVGGSIVGGSGLRSGFLDAENLLSVRVGGSIVGGSAERSGRLATHALQTLQVGGSLIGGSNDNTGAVTIDGTLGSAKIGGSLIGGTSTAAVGANASGYFEIYGDAGAITIGGDLIGSSLSGMQLSNGYTGAIYCEGRLAAVTVAGSIIGGADQSNVGDIFDSGFLFADSFGTVKIGGDIIGKVPGSTGIVAEGLQAPVVEGVKLAIGKLTIGGDVRFAGIGAGFSQDFVSSTNADASIGPVRVVGDWIASNLAAGVRDLGGDGFGRNDVIGAGVNDPALVARIASVVIRGTLVGTGLGSNDHFGIVAQEFGPVTIGGNAFTAASGTGTLLSPVTGDVRLLLVS